MVCGELESALAVVDALHLLRPADLPPTDAAAAASSLTELAEGLAAHFTQPTLGRHLPPLLEQLMEGPVAGDTASSGTTPNSKSVSTAPSAAAPSAAAPSAALELPTQSSQLLQVLGPLRLPGFDRNVRAKRQVPQKELEAFARNGFRKPPPAPAGGGRAALPNRRLDFDTASDDDALPPTPEEVRIRHAVYATPGPPVVRTLLYEVQLGSWLKAGIPPKKSPVSAAASPCGVQHAVPASTSSTERLASLSDLAAHADPAAVADSAATAGDVANTAQQPPVSMAKRDMAFTTSLLYTAVRRGGQRPVAAPLSL